MNVEQLKKSADKRFVTRGVILLVVGLLIGTIGALGYKEYNSKSGAFSVKSWMADLDSYDFYTYEAETIFDAMYANDLGRVFEQRGVEYKKDAQRYESIAFAYAVVGAIGVALVALSIVQFVQRAKDSRGYTRYITTHVSKDLHMEQAANALDEIQKQQESTLVIESTQQPKLEAEKRRPPMMSRNTK